MSRLPRISSKKLVSILLRFGFYIHHQTGSHLNLRHQFKSHLHVVIPVNRRELAPKTLKTIIAQAEIDVNQLLDIL